MIETDTNIVEHNIVISKLSKKIEEIAIRFRFETINDTMSKLIANELTSFIKKTYPKIECYEKCCTVIEFNDGDVSIDLDDKYAEQMLYYYPEEFI